MEIPTATQEVVDSNLTPEVSEAILAHASFAGMGRRTQEVARGVEMLCRIAESETWLSSHQLDSWVESITPQDTCEKPGSDNSHEHTYGVDWSGDDTIPGDVMIPSAFGSVYNQLSGIRKAVFDKRDYYQRAAIKRLQQQVFGEDHAYWPNARDDRAKTFLHVAFSLALEDIGSVCRPNGGAVSEDVILKRFCAVSGRVLAGLQTLDAGFANTSPTLFTHRRENNVAAVYFGSPARRIQAPQKLCRRTDTIMLDTNKVRRTGGFEVSGLTQPDLTTPNPQYSGNRRRMSIPVSSLLSPVVSVSLPELIEEGWWHLPQLDGPESNPMTPRLVIVDGLTDERVQEHVPEHAQTYRQVYSTLGLFARKALLT